MNAQKMLNYYNAYIMHHISIYQLLKKANIQYSTIFSSLKRYRLLVDLYGIKKWLCKRVRYFDNRIRI